MTATTSPKVLRHTSDCGRRARRGVGHPRGKTARRDTIPPAGSLLTDEPIMMMMMVVMMMIMMMTVMIITPLTCGRRARRGVGHPRGKPQVHPLVLLTDAPIMIMMMLIMMMMMMMVMMTVMDHHPPHLREEGEARGAHPGDLIVRDPKPQTRGVELLRAPHQHRGTPLPAGRARHATGQTGARQMITRDGPIGTM
jgi:hypothetical protein